MQQLKQEIVIVVTEQDFKRLNPNIDIDEMRLHNFTEQTMYAVQERLAGLRKYYTCISTEPPQPAPSPWILITPETPIPKDGKEYFTCNMKQGGVARLVYWDVIHNRWKCKSHHLCSLHETHYQPITLPEKGT